MKTDINTFSPEKGIFGFLRWSVVFVASLILAWAYVIYWKQLFHPRLTFAAAFLYIFPLMSLAHVGLSRLLTRCSSLTLQRARRLNLFTHIFFFPLVLLCLRHEFSRTVALLCFTLYLFPHLVLILVCRDRQTQPARRSIFLDIGCVLLVTGLVFVSQYKFLRLDFYWLWGDASYVSYALNLFLGRSITQGIFPLWNPYNAFGVPAYAELQSQFFFPLNLLVAIFSSNYGFYHFVIMTFVLPSAIGGTGLFFLVKYLVRRRWIALSVATAYAFSGFALHDNLAASRYAMAWLPYIVLFGVGAFIRRRRSFRYCVAAAVAYSLAIVSGYPILWYGTGIHLVILAILVSIIKYRHSSPLRVLGKLVFIISLGAVLASPYLITAWSYLPYTNRGEGLSYDAVGNNALTPRSFITLWFPRTAIMQNKAEIDREGGNENKFDMANFNGQDIGQRSVYITIPCLLFAVIALFRCKRYRGLPLLLGGIAFFYLLMSLGGFSFLYELFYYFVPLFSRSRHAAMHRIFFIFYLLLLAAIGMRLTFHNIRDRFIDRVFPWIVILFLAVDFGFILYLLAVILPVFDGDLTLFSCLFHDGLFALLFGGATLIFIFNRRSRRYRNLLIVGLFVLITTDALNYTHARHLICTRKHSVDYQKSLKKMEKNFGLVSNIRKPARDRGDVEWVHDFNFTMGAHVVQPPRGTWAVLRDTESYGKYTGRLFKCYFRAEHTRVGNMFRQMRRGDGETVYIEPGVKVPGWFPESGKEASGKGDTLKILWYAPNLARVRVNTPSGTLLEMVDNYFPGWRVFIGKNEAPIYRVNYSWKGVFVPPGVHEVSFVFIPPTFLLGIMISAVAFCGAICLCLAPRIRWWYCILWLGALGITFFTRDLPLNIKQVLLQNSNIIAGKFHLISIESRARSAENLLFEEEVILTSASHNMPGETVDRLVDGDEKSFWHVSLNPFRGQPTWVIVDFGEGDGKTVRALSARPRNNFPQQFLRQAELLGSDDGKTWKVIAEIDQNGVPADNKWILWQFDNEQAFRYYKFLIVDGHMGRKHLFYSMAELAMFE